MGFKAEVKIIKTLARFKMVSLARIVKVTRYAEKTCGKILNHFVRESLVVFDGRFYSLTQKGKAYLAQLRQGESQERRLRAVERKSVSPNRRRLETY